MLEHIPVVFACLNLDNNILESTNRATKLFYLTIRI